MKTEALEFEEIVVFCNLLTNKNKRLYQIRPQLYLNGTFFDML